MRCRTGACQLLDLVFRATDTLAGPLPPAGANLCAKHHNSSTVQYSNWLRGTPQRATREPVAHGCLDYLMYLSFSGQVRGRLQSPIKPAVNSSSISCRWCAWHQPLHQAERLGRATTLGGHTVRHICCSVSYNLLYTLQRATYMCTW